MAVTSVHPMYGSMSEDWITMRDLYRGERVVKLKGEVYLPPTKGMILDGMQAKQMGREAYDAYKLRAVFPDYIKMAVEAFIGLMHQKPPTFELPSKMEGLIEKATPYGEPLELLLRRINEEQLVSGRAGLLLDLPLNPDPANPMPYITMYTGETITNWDDGHELGGEARLNLVVLNESSPVRVNIFEWKQQTRYRVLLLGDPVLDEPDNTVPYQVGVFSNIDGNSIEFDPSKLKEPMIRGKILEKIPFVFVNSKDIVSTPDEPPLLALGRLALSIYRGEADYRQNLFMQSQDTLVVIGGRQQLRDLSQQETSPLRVGAGTMIELETGGDAKYIGVSSSGLGEQRHSIENDRTLAETRAGQLVNAKTGQKESGNALQTRIGAQTATLNQIAMTGAAALEAILKICAEWVGADPDEVKVTPNLEFANYDMVGKDLVDFMTAINMGAPLSKKSIHDLLVDRGITKMDFDTEMDEMEEDQANAPPKGTQAGGNPIPPGQPGGPAMPGQPAVPPGNLQQDDPNNPAYNDKQED